MIGITFDQTTTDGTLQMHHTRTHESCTCLSKPGFGVPKVTEELQNAGITDEDIENELQDFEEVEREKTGGAYFVGQLLCFAMLLYILAAAVFIAVQLIKFTQPETSTSNDLSTEDELAADDWWSTQDDRMNDDKEAKKGFMTILPIVFSIIPCFVCFCCLMVSGCFLHNQYEEQVFPEWERLCREVNQKSPWAETGVKWVVAKTAVLRDRVDDVDIDRSYVLKILPPGVSGNRGAMDMNGRHAAKLHPARRRPAPRTHVKSQDGLPAGWEVLYDNGTGAPYYHHKPSGKTQWEAPAAKGSRFSSKTTAKSTRHEASESSEGSSKEVYEFLSKNRLKDCWHPLRDDGWDSMEALKEASLEDLMSAGLKRGKAKLLLKKIEAAQFKSSSTRL